jgi:hypothetical protein
MEVFSKEINEPSFSIKLDNGDRDDKKDNFRTSSKSGKKI